jgi:hypothetical protein
MIKVVTTATTFIMLMRLGFEGNATLTTDGVYYKIQTRPLVREGAPRRRSKQFSGKIKWKK